ncbi:MAG: glycosyl transferase family 28 [Ferruginibacter sp.]|nr:glycosyl transferase family 28 [Ferruginibacter sp.]
MQPSLQNINIRNKRVLIAPLDWGLGHATRCVPIIKEFTAQGFDVIIAGEKSGAVLLEKEFPHLKILKLKGYRVSYSKNKHFFFVKLLSQLTKIQAAVRHEHKWLQRIIEHYKIDILVSDNRYGFHNKKCYNIFITHQLSIKTGNRFTQWLAQKINYGYINKFNECWVPDVEGNENLAGQLSHPLTMPIIPIKYIGLLSRFTKSVTEKKYNLVVILSGPEPQRTILEEIILKQLKKITLNTFVVRGLPSAINKIYSENKLVEIINHLPANKLNDLISSSNIVVARSGYSTVMDLAVLQQPSILIPTPGQTEQEYLATYLAAKKYCITAEQKNFDLIQEIQKLSKTVLQKFPTSETIVLKTIINELK